ncbi:sensor histidine kinase [Streptomyces sp. NPDC050560]|uniref:sensor histidine kinase n=1 Tax=Streptomyces sp. NPDC050560 TaxID=3365630 RepID=UPI0037B0B5CE
MSRTGRGGARRAAVTALAVLLPAAAAAVAVWGAAEDWRRVLAAGCAALAVGFAAWTVVLLRALAAGRALRAAERAEARAGAAAAGREEERVRQAELVRQERALRDSVQAAFEGVARTLHRMATVQQGVLDRVERSLDDPVVLGEVMKADHAAAQMTRKAQTLLVMCDVWPARRETRPVSLYDCVRGAMSRIVEFGRVEVHGGESQYVVPTAVEGLMHAVAELLDNATMFSPSSTQVVVTVKTVAAGAVVEIDDAGLGMPFDVLEQATARIGAEVDLTSLGAVPRLGLACVGRWTRELGFRVELSSASAYGGTRAVVFTPLALLTEPGTRATVDAPAPDATAAYSAAEPGAPATGTAGPAAGPPGAAALPRRRNRRRPREPDPGRTAPAGTPPAPQGRDEAADSWSPEAARASIASLMSGTRRGRGATDGGAAPAQHGGESVRDEGGPR